MDILTQGLLGGVLAQSVANKHEKKPATISGLVAGLLADVDFFIRSASDPLLNLEYHRHFTHSIFFVPFGAALAMLILTPVLRKQLPATRLYLYCFTGYCLSGFLDACTSYGTLLFWPLSDQRIALNIISIVDPVFTFVLAVSLIATIFSKGNHIARRGLVICGLYLLVGAIQLTRATNIAEGLAVERDHTTDHLIVKPTIGNLLLWRSIYIHNNQIFVDAVRAGVFRKTEVYEGGSITRFSMADDLPGVKRGSVLYDDIERFNRFSGGYIAFSPDQTEYIGDIRYSMLPDSLKPLWGIRIQPDQPQLHAEYQTFRENTPAIRQAFMDMLF